jgi:acetyl esterase/lipase
MALRGATLETNSATDALVGRGLLEAMVGMFLGSKTDPRDPLANPLENDFKDFPPLYINAGGFETLLSDSETLHAKARAADVNTVVPGMQHVFPALAGRAPEADEEMQRIARWYRAL